MSNRASASLTWRRLGYYEFNYHDQKNGEVKFGDVIAKQKQTINHMNRFKKDMIDYISGSNPGLDQLYTLGTELVMQVRSNICLFYSFYFRLKTGNNKATSTDDMDDMCNFTNRILECLQDEDGAPSFVLICTQRHYTFFVELLYRIIWPLQCAFAFHAIDAMFGIENIAFQLNYIFENVDTDEVDIQYDISNMNPDRKCPLIIANNPNKHIYTYGRAMTFILHESLPLPRIVVHNTESKYESVIDMSMVARVTQLADKKSRLDKRVG